MLGRVTHQTMNAAAQRHLQASSARLAASQEKATSLEKISRPSDDPGAAADAMRVRADLRANSQYARNIDNGNGWLEMADSAMANSVEMIGKARDLVIQGSNGSMSPAAREAIAEQIDGLRADILAQANTKFMGRSLFAGSSDAPAAFTDDPNPVHTGAVGAAVERRIGDGTTIRVDMDGAAVYGSGTDSVFAVLDKISADLRAGLSPVSHMKDLDVFRDKAISGHAELGARHARLLAAKETNVSAGATLEARRAGIEDADLAEMIMDLSIQERNYQAALGVTAKALPPTLMDFLR